MKHETLVEARRTAEAAVSDMPDGPLKTAAFQTILTQLLHHAFPYGGDASKTDPQSRALRRKKDGGSAAAGTTGRLVGLIDEGVFNQQRSLAEIRTLLSERGWHYRLEDLGTPVTRLVRRKLLRRTQVTAGGKKIWKYSVH